MPISTIQILKYVQQYAIRCMDSDLSGGQRYPTFEQPGPGCYVPESDCKFRAHGNHKLIKANKCPTCSQDPYSQAEIGDLFPFLVLPHFIYGLACEADLNIIQTLLNRRHKGHFISYPVSISGAPNENIVQNHLNIAVIYPVDSAIQRLNNRGQQNKTTTFRNVRCGAIQKAPAFPFEDKISTFYWIARHIVLTLYTMS